MRSQGDPAHKARRGIEVSRAKLLDYLYAEQPPISRREQRAIDRAAFAKRSAKRSAERACQFRQ